jgi:transposase, IS30 family
MATLEGRGDGSSDSQGIVPTLLTAVGKHGGIAPRARRRSRLALTLAEREEISRGLCARRSVREIARRLGRSPSTISREIARNSAQWWRYRAQVADRHAWHRALRPKQCQLGRYPRLAALDSRKNAYKSDLRRALGWPLYG